MNGSDVTHGQQIRGNLLSPIDSVYFLLTTLLFWSSV
jgi:hypothetical protein